jgi:hypothetical protein
MATDNCWKPSVRQEEFLRTVIGMSLDCLQHKGTNNAAAYIANLRTIADILEEEKRGGE